MGTISHSLSNIYLAGLVMAFLWSLMSWPRNKQKCPRSNSKSSST